MALVDDFEKFRAASSEQPVPPPQQDSFVNEFEAFRQTASALKAAETPTEISSVGAYKSRAGVGRTPTPAPAPTPAPEPTTPKPSLIDIAKQSSIQARASNLAREKKIEENQFSFKDLSEKPDLFKSINDYALARHGKDGAMLPNETKDDYVKRWATEMRKIPSDTWEAGKERLWIENAKQEDVLKAVKAYDIWKNTANFYSPKGQEGFRPIVDYLISGAGDPLNLLSIITGGVAGTAAKQIAKEGIKGAIKKKLAVGAPVVGVEAGSAAYSAIEEKQIELLGQKASNKDARSKLEQTKKIAALLPPQEQKEINNSIQQEEKRISESEDKVKEGVKASDLVLPTAVGTLFGTAGTAALLSSKTKGLSLEEVLDTRRSLKQGEIRIEPKMDVSVPPPKVEITAKDPTEIQLEDAYDIFEGRKLLDKEGDPTAIAEMQIRNDVNKKAAQIAGNIWSQIPELAPKGEQKISDAVKNVFMNIENIDDVVLRDALANAGVTPEEFARMNRTTAGDAGRTLQAYSVLARLQNTLKNIDKAAAKEVDLMYGKRNTLTSAFTGFYDLTLRVDRELKALMVSQIATTVRNAYSGLAVVTFGAASEAIESALYRMGKTAYELGSGKPLTGSFTGGLKGVYDDAVRTSFYLGQANLSSDVAERLLAGSPTLRSRILRTVGENDATDLSKVAQIANTLNVAQDAFFRKAIFASSVEKQLSRVGINMYDVIEQGKNVPIDVLKNATDEALAATFSKMPTKGIMFYAVKVVEALGPLGSTFAPFPRFMANAMTWTNKHSPVGIFAGAADIAKGSSMLRAGNEEGQRYLMQGLENTSKGVVGTAAIYAAYKYRQENQDTTWYDVKNPDGSTVDARALFPAAPFLAMGDYLVKLEKGRTDEFGTKEFLEAMTGFKAPAGTSAWLGDKFAESVSNMQTGEGSADQKVSTFLGEWAGQYFGRAFVPLQQVSDLVAAVDRDEALPRDAYQIPAGEEGFLSSFGSQIQKQIPIVKQKGIEVPTIDQGQLSTRKIEGLPVYQPATRTEAAFSDAGPLKMFTGIRVKVAPRPLEEEITKLKIPNNKIFTSTGDKIVDASARKIMAPLALSYFETIKETPLYKEDSQDGKKIYLQNILSWAQTNAEEIATKQSEADALNENKKQLEEWEKKVVEAISKGEIPPEKPVDIQARFFAIKYSKLPPEVKRETAALYKQNTKKDLEETKDYTLALAFAAMVKDMRAIEKKQENKQPGFAAGGLAAQMAGALIGKGAAKVAKKSITESADDLLKKVTDMATKAGVEVAPATKQTDELLKAPAAPLVIKKKAPALAPELQQIQDTLPANAPSAITPEQTQQMTDIVNESAKSIKTPASSGNFADEINKYSSDQLKQAESLLKTSMGSQYKLDKFKADTPDDYQKSLLIKLQEIAPEGAATPPTPKDLTLVSPEVDPYLPISLREKKRLSEIGDLNIIAPTSEFSPNYAQRKELLYNIREIRKDAFPVLVDSLDELSFTKGIKPLDEDVVAVAQGEYRAAKGMEVDVDDLNSIEDFASFASKYQDKLDALRIKYKDEPPVILYHGSKTERTPEKLKRGFFDPQRSTKSHFELDAGAVSFTKDPNLNYYVEKFGGKEPKNISQTEIPYADYEFRRVNMPLDAYEGKDLNYLARAINGSPTIARPLSLPRSAIFRETEDAFVEADKLKITQDLAGVTEKYGKIAEKDKTISEAMLRLQKFSFGLPKLASPVDKTVGKDKKIIYTQREPRNAYQAYKDIRTVFNQLTKSGEVTSTKTGYGQNYITGLQKYAPDLMSSIDKLMEVYNARMNPKAIAASPKPLLLEQMRNSLEKLLPQGDEKILPIERQTEAVETIRDITPKLNKGGGLGLKKDSTEEGLAPYGLRNSGEGAKGKGYFGALPNKEGGVSTEISSEFTYKGKNVEHPLIVPTLNKAELNHLLAGKEATDAIYSKAQAFAKKRIDAGKSAFAEPTELRYPTPDQKGLASRR